MKLMLRKFKLRPSLLTSFTLVSFLLLAAIAVILIVGIQRRLENNALQQEANSAADQVTLILNPNLWAKDLVAPLAPPRFAAIDTLIRTEILHEHIVHVRIYLPDGTLLYSDEPNLVGKKFPISDELALALKGGVGMDVSDLSKPENATERGQYSHLLEVYVPLHPVNAPGQVLGAYEIYHDLSVVQPSIDEMRLYVAVSVSLGFLVLFLALFFLVRNASRELVLRNEENSALYQETKKQVLELQRSEEQSQRRYQRLVALRAIDEAISASLNLTLTLRVFLDQATAQLQVDAADVLLFNHSTQVLAYAAGRGFRTEKINTSLIRLGDGDAGRTALERRLLTIPDLTQAKDFTRPALVADEAFHAYYAVPLITKGQVRGVLEIFHRSALSPDKDWLEFLEGLAEQASIAIGSAELFDSLMHSNIQLSRAYESTIEGWSHALDLRDKETEGHTRRVTEMTVNLATMFGMSIGDDQLVHIRRGALLHDIGKMGVPDTILLKPGPLTDEEWQLMRKHPVYAYEMLSSIEYLRPALDIPYCHHEKWDGSGYPRGLKGEGIPFSARLFAVVDVWDALCSDRPYREGWSQAKAREYILEQRGTHFDPGVVDIFLKMLDKES
jgi:HD-GYP domain-containing protein (c-di-GMP phosphodiesterase class II)